MIPGYQFRDPARLAEALTHASYAHEHPGVRDYERLEFLGDAVLQLIVTEMLMERRPVWQEGQLSRARTRLVNKEALAEVSGELGFPALLVVAEHQPGVRAQRKVWSQLFESVLGAIHEDGGWAVARAWARPILDPHLDRITAAPTEDPKSRLQQLWQKRHKVVPRYEEVGRSGPGNALVFACVVHLGAATYGPAEGGSRRLAEAAAAQLALDALGITD